MSFLGRSPYPACGMSRVDFFCSHRHYVDHLLPVYVALPEKFRGEFHVGSVPANPDRLTVVASHGDYKLTKGPVVMFEHGAGFTYNTDHQSYAGGKDRGRVVLFCSPNQLAAAPYSRNYPDVPQEIVGCPKLDSWSRREWVMPKRPTVAFSFHWDCQVVPETRTAWPHYQPFFASESSYIRRGGNTWDYVGHGHPRSFEYLRKQWSKFGIEPVREFNDVVVLADIYVCDSSSTQYEWAALGRPTIVLNAPWYRKDVRQGEGLRFWDHVPGVQVEGPWDLRSAIKETMLNDTFAETRLQVTSLVYPYLGESAGRAAAAIVQLVA